MKISTSSPQFTNVTRWRQKNIKKNYLDNTKCQNRIIRKNPTSDILFPLGSRSCPSTNLENLFFHSAQLFVADSKSNFVLIHHWTFSCLFSSSSSYFVFIHFISFPWSCNAFVVECSMAIDGVESDNNLKSIRCLFQTTWVVYWLFSAERASEDEF